MAASHAAASADPGPARGGRRRVGDAAFGAFVVLLGLWIAVETALLPVGPSYARVGPRIFPWLVAAALVLAGAALLWQAWRAGDDTPDLPVFDRWPLLVVGAGLVGQVLLLETLGFVLASTLMFAAVARAFGSASWPRNVAIGLVLCTVVHLGFSRGLGLHLPTGLPGRLF